MLKLLRKKIGIIGYGNMGSAITERIKAWYRVIIFDKDRNKTQGITDVEVAKDLGDLVKRADAVILAVKPQDFDFVLNEIKEYSKDKLIISIAAGISTQFIEKILGEIRVVRVMPNLAASIGKGISCLCKGRFATSKNLSFTLKLFRFLGITLVLKEEMMDAVTAVSGSGVGFWGFAVEDKPRSEWEQYSKNVFIPDYSLAAENVGFDRQLARLLAEKTVMGSLAIVEAWHIEPLELKQRVASKGGTTEAGLEVLKKGGSLTEAVKAALLRAKELGKKE